MCGLGEYNPTTSLNGPWIVRDNKHYCQTSWRNPDNPKCTKFLDVEFMLELPEENQCTLYQEWTLKLNMPLGSKSSRVKDNGDIFYRGQDNEVLAIFGLVMVLVCHGWDTLPVLIKRTDFDKLPACHLGREDEFVQDLEQHFRKIVPLHVNNCSQKIDIKQIQSLIDHLQDRAGQQVFESFLSINTRNIAHICDLDSICTQGFFN